MGMIITINANKKTKEKGGELTNSGTNENEAGQARNQNKAFITVTYGEKRIIASSRQMVFCAHFNDEVGT
ncbi:TPA: hypothetical protein ACTYZB_004875 [Klebsiella variicola]